MDPSFLVLDEPTSMLDVISQAQVIQLLQEIQQEREVGYLLISHDRALCERFCTAIRPLEGGRLGRTRMKNAPSSLSRTAYMVECNVFAD